jgi:Flp pilus assembly pilin Flp
MSALLKRLQRQDDGATLVEFAIIAPIFFALLLALFDLGQSVYVRSTLNGAMQEAGRNSGLESGFDNQGTIDQYVADQVHAVTADANIEFKRMNYRDFSQVGKPEDFIDANKNGVYDDNECFTDANGNGEWDADMGANGLGGANDVVAYSATVTYERLFPLWNLLGLQPTTQVSATTIMRNQPFSTQAARPTKQICPHA